MFRRFLIVGSLGFLVDSGLTHALILAGLSPLAARLPAMLVAMLVTWLANRRFTFETGQQRSTAELLRYALVAGAAFLLNYSLYSFAVVQGLTPLLAIVLASAAQVGFSFFGYRRFVFR